MNDYTVVLLFPDYLADDYGKDTYTALVTASDIKHAVEVAQREAFDSNKDSEDPEDFALVLMFQGHHEPCAFSWSL